MSYWNPILKVMKCSPPFFTAVALSWGYYAYVRHFCVGCLGNLVILKCLYFLIAHALLTMFVAAFIKVSFGRNRSIPRMFRVPRTFTADLCSMSDEPELRRRRLHEYVRLKSLPVDMRDDFGEVRFCVKCSLVKPDRAHHCSVCDRCVLRMDHHCPWLQACIGFDNHKYYCVFLGYALAVCLFVAVTTAPYCYAFLQDGTPIDATVITPNAVADSVARWYSGNAATWRHFFMPTSNLLRGSEVPLSAKAELLQARKFHVVMLFFISAMWCIPIISLLYDHLMMMWRNQTSIECVQGIKLVKIGRFDDVFNLGGCRNMQQIFGAQWHDWFLPTFSTKGNGYQFPRRKFGWKVTDGIVSSATVSPSNTVTTGQQDISYREPVTVGQDEATSPQSAFDRGGLSGQEKSERRIRHRSRVHTDHQVVHADPKMIPYSTGSSSIPSSPLHLA